VLRNPPRVTGPRVYEDEVVAEGSWPASVRELEERAEDFAEGCITRREWLAARKPVEEGLPKPSAQWWHREQPASFAILIVMVGFVFALVFDSPGLRVAEPKNVLHEAPATAPAGAAMIPAGTRSATATRRAASLRLPEISPLLHAHALSSAYADRGLSAWPMDSLSRPHEPIGAGPRTTVTLLVRL
jgi:hypothetical protein